MHQLFRRHYIAHSVPFALIVHQNEGVDAVIFFVAEAIGCLHRREGARHVGMTRRKLLQLRRLGRTGRTATASSIARKSAPDETGKNLSELITMSVSPPSGT